MLTTSKVTILIPKQTISIQFTKIILVNNHRYLNKSQNVQMDVQKSNHHKYMHRFHNLTIFINRKLFFSMKALHSSTMLFFNLSHRFKVNSIWMNSKISSKTSRILNTKEIKVLTKFLVVQVDSKKEQIQEFQIF